MIVICNVKNAGGIERHAVRRGRFFGSVVTSDRDQVSQ